MTKAEQATVHPITPYAIAVDMRSSKLPLGRQAEQVHTAANQHFFGNPVGLVKGRKGTFLGTNTVRKYHVASVAYGVWVAATRDLAPKDTRLMAKRIVGGSTR